MGPSTSFSSTTSSSSSMTTGGGLNSPSLSTHSNSSNYSTGGTRLQAKSALAERTTREDLKSLRDVFDMGPTDDDLSRISDGLKSSSSSSNSNLNDKNSGSGSGGKKWSIKDLRLGPGGFTTKSSNKSNEEFHPSTEDEDTPTIINIDHSLAQSIIYPQLSNLQSRKEKSRREFERESIRKRRPETVEFSQTMWIWSKDGASLAGKEFGMLSDNVSFSFVEEENFLFSRIFSDLIFFLCNS